jgi:hypothetical protein
VADLSGVSEAWFTPDDMEEVLWMERSRVEAWLLEEGLIEDDQKGADWLIDLATADRLILQRMGMLPDHAEFPRDDAVQLLLRYAQVLAEKRREHTWMEPDFEHLRKEMDDWRQRIRPLLRTRLVCTHRARRGHVASLVAV